MNPTQTPAPADDSQQDTPNVTPQEQQQYDTVVTACLQLIFGKGTFPEVVNRLVTGQNSIALTIGHMSAMIMQSVNGGVLKAGRQIPANVMFGAGQELVSAVVDLAVHLNLMKQADFQKVYQASLFEGMRVWGLAMGHNGSITPQLQQESQQALQAMKIKQGAPAAPSATAAGSAAPSASPDTAAAQTAPPTGVVNQALPQGQ
jgi:hypothetical protein